MPVFVTHADTPIGVQLVEALVADGADVRAFANGTGDVSALRTAGAIVAVGEHDDEGHLDAAMTHAHTVVVPEVSWLAAPDVVDRDLAVIMRAAVLAGVVRVVVLSLVGADPGADHPLLAALGRVERQVADADVQSLVVRTDGLDGAAAADVAAALDCPDAALAPVPVDDLVAGLVALDRARSQRTGGHALFTALGPRRGVADLRADVDLVGRRWLPPARRGPLVDHLCGRGAPVIEGADLWDFVARLEAGDE